MRSSKYGLAAAWTIGAALACAAGCSGEADSATAPDTGAGASSTGSSSLPNPELCGDGTCSHDDGEVCETCEADCGACPVCGNGACEKSTGQESCDACPEDCGACSTCGDGACDAPSGEDCTTCVDDCGACDTCGNGACDEAETCASCEDDCGACDTCGDGECDKAAGESCSSCKGDCGACDTCGDGECQKGAGESCSSCAKDCGSCEFKGCVEGDFKPFWGGLHAHTHVSDGEGSPAEAFNHARNVAKPGYDFLWLSDHRPGITPTEWAGCRAAANKYNKDGVFAAGCGTERPMTDDANKLVAHLNTLFVDKLHAPVERIGAVYDQLSECVPCVGQINHPGMPGTAQNWKFYPKAQDAMRLIEFNGGRPFDVKFGAYLKSLDNGWSMSPSWNEDNHHRGWGSSGDATLVWTTELSRTGIRAGVRANRTVATNDKTARLKMMADKKCWMGSHLEGKGKAEITVDVSDSQAGDVFERVVFWGPGEKQLAARDCKSKNPCSVSYIHEVTKKSFVVALARQKDGGVLVSAPIWFEP